MCAQCWATAAAASGGAAGLRAWLAAWSPSWLTAPRLRVITVAALTLAVLAAGIRIS